MATKYKKTNEFTRLGVPPNVYVGTDYTGLTNSNLTGTNDDVITSSMKSVDRDKATLEAERGEAIVKPNLTGLYRIGGKTHAQGGTPLAAEPGSFIFSNSKDLAFTKGEKELFKFKLGGTHKAKNNTPAKVLFREVDPKEYNRLMSIVNDKNSDKVAKETAALMLAKYQEKMGQVAMLQEAKKGEEMPDFAVAPEVNPAEEAKEDQQEMFEEGGKTGRKVDKAPDGYKFDREEGGKKYYTKAGGSGQLAVAQAGQAKGGAEYEGWLKSQLGAGISPDELAGKGYISKDKIGAYAGFYKPTMDTVYTEQGAAQPVVQTPAQGGRGQMVYSPDKHGVGEIFYHTRDSNAITDPGTLNTAAEYATIKFRNDFGYTGEQTKLSGPEFQKYFGTTNTFQSPEAMNELRTKSAVTKFNFGGELPKAEYGVNDAPPDKTGKWAFDYNNLNGKKKGWNGMHDFSSPEDYAKAVGFNGNPKDIKAMQQYVKDTYPDLVDYYHSDSTFGMPKNGIIDGNLGVRWEAIAKSLQRDNSAPDIIPRDKGSMGDIKVPDIKMSTTNPSIGTPQSNVPQKPWEGFDFAPNSMEKLSIAAPYLTALSIKPQYDALIQANTTNLRFDRLDNSQEVADMNQRASTEARAAYQNATPMFARQAAAAASAQATQSEGQSNANTRNANASIGSQEVQTNAQRQDGTYQFNLKEIKEVGRNNKLTDQRRDYELANAATQSLNNGMTVSRNLEQLGNAATMSAMPYVTNEKDANGNDLVRYDDKGNPYKQQGVPFNFSKNRRPVFTPQFGSLNSYGVQSKSSSNTNLLNEYQAKFQQAANSGDTKLAYIYQQAIKNLGVPGVNSLSNNPMASLLQNMFAGMGGQ